MKNVFSVLVLATSFALLVPENRAQALGAADIRPSVSVASQRIITLPAISEISAPSSPQGSPELTWMLALGFLATVMARRLRAD